MNDQKPYAPAADRNRAAIFDALVHELMHNDHIIEFGSGTGQHMCHFAKRRPGNTWQPSDLPEQLPGIRLWITESGCSNILPPMAIDLADDLPSGLNATLCYSANTLHIVSWPLVQRFFLHAAAVLHTGGKLCVYGPFLFNGLHTSEGNRLFDQQLRCQDPSRGLRDVMDLNQLATQHLFLEARVVDMPANNHLLIWDRNIQGE